ncbi:MaoC family dehydratase [Novosphingobium bradum]|uniref:MaoC family dehydratase n=1 Tax=Novosphingobium bradum TaxID=1737444 RepID=A0ABV7ILV2_9SPHN
MTERYVHTPPEGNFFEDFAIGRQFLHPTPRTITEGDASLYIALTGARQPLPCSQPLAMAMGYRAAPLDDGLLFNMAFGKTVSDISANAVANLGYADLRFLEPVHAGDTLTARSEVIGLRPTSSGDNGVVYVRSSAFNQHGRPVLTWIRWVLVHARARGGAVGEAVVPDLPERVEPADLRVPAITVDVAALVRASGAARLWDDYAIGQRIDHAAGMTLDETDHTLATRLYQNGAKVHFDAQMMASTPHGRRLVYGGHVISVCRALAFEGLENVIGMLAINGGSHRAPTFAGDTLYCFTEVLDKFALPGRADLGGLRLRLVGIKNRPAAGFLAEVEEGGKVRFDPAVVLDLDYTVMIPRG